MRTIRYHFDDCLCADTHGFAYRGPSPGMGSGWKLAVGVTPSPGILNPAKVPFDGLKGTRERSVSACESSLMGSG